MCLGKPLPSLRKSRSGLNLTTSSESVWAQPYGVTYLEERVKTWLQLLTLDDGVFAHFKEVDEGRVGLEHLFGLKG